MNRSTCTICSDLLTLTDVAACLCIFSSGHTFHYHCLVAWKECSPTCPQCRHKFTTPIKLFFDLAVTDDSNVDVSTLKVQMDDLKINLTLKEQECLKIKEKQLSYEKEISSLTHELQSMSELLQNAQGHNSILKKQISYLEKVQSDYEKSKAEVVSLEKKLNSFANINVLVKADRQEVESILKNCADSSESLIQIKTSYIILKKVLGVIYITPNTHGKVYHGGTLFGKSSDDPSLLAKTVLGIMIHKVVICDGNRVNQAFFKLYRTIPEKSWKTEDFQDYLNEIAIAPKPIERQNVSTCLKVFSDKTYHALLTYSQIISNSKDTAIFINKVITWWKILNVKGRGADVRHNDPLEAPICSPDDCRRNTLLQFGDMALEMYCKNGKRVKQLSNDTAKSIHHTCYGIVKLCKYLLATSHDYVLLGMFTRDHLEREFGKLRQGSGGAYFINVQQIIEKLHINHTSLLLSLNIDIDSFDFSSGHECASCTYVLCEAGIEIFDNLEKLELSISDTTKMSLIYIAGYMYIYHKYYVNHNHYAFDKLQDTKNKLEAEKKQLKRHVETLERECREHRGKVDSLTTDVTHLNEINKKLMEKVQNLECSFNISSPFIQPSKKNIAESSRPVIKRSRFYDEGFNDKNDKNTTIELFDDSSDLASCFHENDDIEIAELYGLKSVATTNMAEQRVPLRDIKSSKLNIKLHTQTTSSSGHLMPQGFNGMGGQSRVLVLPKKSFSTIAKTSAAIRNARKLPKSKSKHNLKETKIPDFLGSPITLSP
uniref:TRAF-interacting protein n=1 Tax=Hydra vulgaris TaxID=6087 RepID=T2M5R2_HYDVU